MKRIISIALLAILVTAGFWFAARTARKESDDILSEFKKVSASIDTSDTRAPYGSIYETIDRNRQRYDASLLQKADSLVAAARAADTFFAHLRERVEPIINRDPESLKPIITEREIEGVQAVVHNVAAACYRVADDDVLKHKLDSVFALTTSMLEKHRKETFTNMPAIALLASISGFRGDCDDGSKIALKYIQGTKDSR